MIRALALLLALAVCACSSPETVKRTAKTGDRSGKVVDRRLGVSASPYRALTYNVSSYKVGEPYKIAERWYRPKEYETFSETGIASWYGHKFHSRQTANGEVFNMYAMTAAHRVPADAERRARYQFRKRPKGDRAHKRPRPLRA